MLLACLTLALLPAHEPDDPRFTTTRQSPIVLPLPDERDAFFFVVVSGRIVGLVGTTSQPVSGMWSQSS